MLLKKMFSFAANSAACLTLILSPVAQGAQVKFRSKEYMQEFLKTSGLVGGKKTVGEFYSQIRHWYPEKLRSQLDAWATFHKDDPMPTVDLQTVTDQFGQQQFRILFERDGQTLALETADDHVKFGSIKITAADYYEPQKLIDRVRASDPYMAKAFDREKPTYSGRDLKGLPYSEFSRLSPEQRAVYFLQMREAVEHAEKILGPNENVRSSFLFNPVNEMMARWMFGDEAGAKAKGDLPAGDEVPPRPPADIPESGNSPPQRPKPGKPAAKPASKDGGSSEVRGARVGGTCIVSGYVSSYGENFSCGGVKSGRADFVSKIEQTFRETFPKAPRCSGGTFPCNPLVYGFDDGGNPHCISTGEMRFATKNCNKKSPLNGADDLANKKRIVQSWLKAKGSDHVLKFDEKGEKLEQESYEKIKKELDSLGSYIGEAVGFCDSPDSQKLLKARDEQKSACDSIRVRAFALEAFAPKPKVPDCVGIEGSQPVETSPGKYECKCAEGTRQVKKGGMMVCDMVAECPPAKSRRPAEPPIEDDEDSKPAKPKLPPQKEDCSGLFCGTNWLMPLLLIGGVGLFAWWMTRSNASTNTQVPVYVPPVPPPTQPVPTLPTLPNPPPPPAPPSEGGTGVSPINGGGVRGNR